MREEQNNAGSSTALVVNNDPEQLNVISELLRKIELEPRTFTTADAALAAITGSPPPAIIVTDLYLPVIDGWRFCRLLRSSEYAVFNRVPIVVVSATYSGEEPDRIAADLGSSAFIPAPVNGKDFIEQIRAILEGRQERRPLRALIVEDSKTLLYSLKRVFETNGYETHTSLTVQSAIDAIERNVYNVAVLDYHLPDGSGDSLLDILHAGQPDCVCLMMTINPEPELALDWMRRGAAAYLRKPFDPEYLIELCNRTRRERSLLRAQDLLRVRTQELCNSEHMYRTLVENLNDILYILDDKAVITYISPNIESIGGYTPDEMIGRCFIEFVHPDDREGRLGQFLKILSGVNEPSEYRYLTKDGRIIWVRTAARAVIRDGRCVGVQGVLTDITNRKQAEDELREHEQQLSAIYKNAPLIMMLVDKERKVRKINMYGASFAGKSIEETIGYRGGEALGCLYAQESPDGCGFGPHCDACIVRKTVLDTIETGQTHRNIEANLPFRIRNENEELFFLISTTKLKLKNEELVLVSMIDITDRTRAEEALQESKDRYRTERKRLERQLLHAQKLECIGTLAGGVAHDLNNVLGAILGHADIGRQDISPDDPVYSRLSSILDLTERGARITQQLLAFSGRQELQPKKFDINILISDLLKLLDKLLGEHIAITFDACPDLRIVSVDPAQMDQVLMNLCVNARDAIPDGGHLTISTANIHIDEEFAKLHIDANPGNYVLISVSDSGVGIPSEHIDRIFEPFFTTKEADKGTGLGLSVVHGIIGQHKGFINVYSEAGIGTTFNIYIPAVDGEPERDLSREKKVIPRGSGTVLVVEDDADIRIMVEMLLQNHGYTVLSAPDGEKGIDVFTRHAGQIDLVVSDVIMPKVSGKELYLQVNTVKPGTKFLFMSGYTAETINKNFKELEGIDFIAKPFVLAEFCEKVSEILRR